MINVYLDSESNNGPNELGNDFMIENGSFHSMKLVLLCLVLESVIMHEMLYFLHRKHSSKKLEK